LKVIVAVPYNVAPLYPVIVIVELFAAVGVPEINPSEGLNVSPEGKVPDVKTKLLANTGDIDGLELKEYPMKPLLLL
jgi:hypothetical protein